MIPCTIKTSTTTQKQKRKYALTSTSKMNPYVRFFTGLKVVFNHPNSCMHCMSKTATTTEAVATTTEKPILKDVCFEGYIMDRFCIDRGTLLDDQKTKTLLNPVSVSARARATVRTLNPKHLTLNTDP